MKIIPKIPQDYKLINWLRQLPISLQVILIIFLFYLTWHFRYFVSGVNEAELVKVEGVLYSVDCTTKLSGSDTIVLHTSFPEREVSFSGWQKCKNLSKALNELHLPEKVTYYTKRFHGVMSENNEGTLWIYAVDLTSSNEQLIYPVNGLGINYEPNVWCLVFFFIALILIESLRERWSDYRKLNRN
ncbi:hypothetical protein G3485_23180 [Shewanella baltica]|uniref:hypothetical protein n=1 Tax=Shewanella baltica TaxID=62322 RepID=UPI0021689F46|nr:hypothetical protein [Shewanella baltica]MCS6113550.1 hypothetical protein [Shewanella baltica]MCS6129999.1 hypothetical protein [Shewanella baltica]MCS6141907.1 hypothetical protein [Shewanella baltica]MCS6148242.1 hypothetical protein [Shewanella baltica]MCS6172795.1 hypothetical protein [Shewanella baltica]